jgi:hypothetical protein
VTSYLEDDAVRQASVFQQLFDKIAEDSLTLPMLIGIGCQRVRK